MYSCNSKAKNTLSDNQEIGLKTNTSVSDTSKRNRSGVDLKQFSWPGFHGKDRHNKSQETNLAKSWPVGGPEMLWTVSGLGVGYSSVSIADGMIFTSGTYDNQTYVFAFDLDGKLIWKKPNGSTWNVEVSWAKGYDGPRSTPTFDNGMVYHQSELNKLTAYKASNGDVVWSRDLMKDFETEMPIYGFTESVLIEGEKLYIKPSGKKGFQVCLNKTNGETIWVNNEIQGTYAYNSPVLHDFGGYHQLISASSEGYFGVDTETGKLLWKVNFENQYKLNCTDAVVVNDYVFISNGAGGGSMLIKLKSSGKAITTQTIWETELMDNYHGGIIYHNGYFYGSGDRSRGWFSIDMQTGKQMWKSPASMGSLTYADEMLYMYDEKGTMRLVKATPDRYEVTGEFKLPKGTGPYWAHPVVCGGRLYLRHADKLYVFDINKK
jgi:hypothetical protein